MRAEADLGADRMNAKIRKAQLLKVPYMLVVGEREVEAGAVALRKRDGSAAGTCRWTSSSPWSSERIRTRSAEL